MAWVTRSRRPADRAGLRQERRRVGRGLVGLERGGRRQDDRAGRRNRASSRPTSSNVVIQPR